MKWEQEELEVSTRSESYLWHGKKGAERSDGRLVKGFFEIMIRS